MRKIKQFRPGSTYSFKKLIVFAAAFAPIGIAALVLTRAAIPYEDDTVASTASFNQSFADTDAQGLVPAPAPDLTPTPLPTKTPTTIMSFWNSTSTPPSQITIGPSYAVTTGIRWESTRAGTVSGVRWYKVATDTGSHVVSLWAGTGILLAKATASGESASGWQQASFSSPVSVAANTTYVASVHHPNGSYGYADKGLLNGFTKTPLTAAAGINGLYTYGAASAFPTLSHNSSNYYVDISFTPR